GRNSARWSFIVASSHRARDARDRRGGGRQAWALPARDGATRDLRPRPRAVRVRLCGWPALCCASVSRVRSRRTFCEIRRLGCREHPRVLQSSQSPACAQLLRGNADRGENCGKSGDGEASRAITGTSREAALTTVGTDGTVGALTPYGVRCWIAIAHS